MLIRKLVSALAAIVVLFSLTIVVAGAEAQYVWTEHNTVEISGYVASEKSGVNVVVQILKPGEDLTTITKENIVNTVEYHNQTVTQAGGFYSFTAQVTDDTQVHTVLVRESDSKTLDTLVVEPNILTAEASLDAIGHMYYDSAEIPLKIKASKSGTYNVSVEISDASGFSDYTSVKNFQDVVFDETKTAEILLNLEHDSMRYGIFNVECRVSGDESVTCSTQFSISRMTKQGDENKLIGTAQHFFSNQRTGDINTELDILRKAGIKLQRQSVYWDTFETTKGEYKFNERTGRYFDILGEKRLSGIVQLYGGNALYYPTNEDGSYQRDESGNLIDYPPNTEAGLLAFGEYAYNLALKTKDYTNYYEIWNEYNLTSFNPRNLPAKCYADMLKAVYNKIHAGNPEAVVIGMSPAGYGEETLSWVREVLEECGDEKVMDAICLHVYNQPEDIEKDSYIQDFKDLCAEYGYEDIKVFVSETGFSSGLESADELSQAKKHIRNLALMSDDAEQIYIYNAFEKQNSTDKEKGYGIVRGQFDESMPYYAKPAYVAIANFNRLTGNFISVTQEQPSYGVYKVSFTKKDGSRCFVLWSVNAFVKNYMLDTQGSTSVKKYDIFGNSEILTDTDGVYTLKLSDTPIYIEIESDFGVEYADSEGFIIDSMRKTDTVDVISKIRKYKEGSKLYAASYKEGRLIDCRIADAVVGERVLTVNTKDADKVSVYYWYADALKPVTNLKAEDLKR